MADDVDALMGAALPEISASAIKVLDDAPKLQSYVPVESWTDARPYRLVKSRWVPRPVGAALPTGEDDAFRRQVSTFAASVTGATEVEVCCTCSATELRDAADQVREKTEALAREARLLERRVVLRALCDRASNGGRYTLHDAIRQSWIMRRKARLVIGPGLTEAATRTGEFDGVMPDHDGLPTHVRGLLIPTYQGPKVKRAVDDLKLTWRRGSESSGVELRIAGRHILIHGRNLGAKFFDTIP